MMRDAHPLLRRLLAVALLLAPAAALHALAIAPSLDERERLTRFIAQSRDILARRAEIEERHEALQAQAAALRRGEGAQSGVFQAGNEALLAAELQAKIKRLADLHRAELTSTQVLAGRDEEQFRRVTVRAHLAASAEGLQRILHAVESQSPFLFVDAMDLRLRPARAASGAQSPSDPSLTLDARLDLSAYLRRSP